MHAASHKGAETAKMVKLTSQLEMVVTQWAFVGPILLFGHHLGISSTIEEEKGFIQFWRGVGYLLGIEDR